MKASLTHPDPPLVVNTPTCSLMCLYQKARQLLKAKEMGDRLTDPGQPGAAGSEASSALGTMAGGEHLGTARLVQPREEERQEALEGRHWRETKLASFKEWRGAAEQDRRAGTPC